MTRNPKILLIVAAAITALAIAYFSFFAGPDRAAGSNAEGAEKAKPGVVTAQQMKALGIETAVAIDAGSVPLGTVPALVSLPPEARVAVTAPFEGAIIRIYVVDGQTVERGTALALIKVRETLQVGADLARARAELGLARANANRLNQLAREGIISGARADEANAALRSAQVTVSENQKILTQAGADSGGQMTLRAPINGRVSAVNVQTGGPVDTMTAPFVIDNTSSYMLDIQLPERLAKSVSPGMPVQLNMPQTRGAEAAAPIGGTIISVSPTLDPMTRSVMAKARIGSAPGIIAGKNVMVTITGNGEQTGVSVPAKAVTHIGGNDYVFVLTENRFAKRQVTMASQVGETAILNSGLKVSEKVATSGIAELKVMLGGD